MTQSKNTKKALLASVLSLVLCFTMLIGSTFAWFTDTATTGVNKIVAGNLDIELSYKNAKATTYTEVSADTKDLFVDENGDAMLWEPGAVSVCYFKLENLGTLDIKYVLSVISEDVVTYNGAALSKVLKTAVVETSAVYTDRAEAIAAAKAADAQSILTYRKQVDVMKAPTETAASVEYFAMVIYFPEEIGNTYEGETYNLPTGEKPLETTLQINLQATQASSEKDSFDEKYDVNAWLPLLKNERRATTSEELVAILADLDGVDTIYLSGSFGATTLPAGTNGVSLVAESGTTMESLNINGAKNVVIDGLTFDAAKAVQTYKNPGSSNSTSEAQAFTASVYTNRSASAPNAGENITIKNCVFQGTATVDNENETGYTAINFNDAQAGTRTSNIVVEECTFNCDAVSYIYINYPKADSYVTISNNTFGSAGNSVAWAAVAVQQGNNVDVQITNNIFNSWDAADGAVKVGRANSTSANLVKATITENTFNGTVADDSCVIEIRRTGNTGHVISENIYNITDRTLDDGVTASSDKLDSTVAVWYRQYDQNLPQ